MPDYETYNRLRFCLAKITVSGRNETMDAIKCNTSFKQASILKSASQNSQLQYFTLGNLP